MRPPTPRPPIVVALLLVVAAAALPAAHAASKPAAATSSSKPATATTSSNNDNSRRTISVNIANNQTFPLRLPSHTPPTGNTTHFLRTYQDTCGGFDAILVPFGEAGDGVPPHIHYPDDAFFMVSSTGSGRMRFYAPQAPAIVYTPGMLPGWNAPAPKLGSVEVGPGDLVYVPKGSVMWYQYVTNVTEFWSFHTTGYGVPSVIKALKSSGADDLELLRRTGLDGAPIDRSGKMAGCADGSGKSCYYAVRGPIVLADPKAAAERLQKMFDTAEAKNCFNGPPTYPGGSR